MFKITKQFDTGEGRSSSKADTPSLINYSWLEIVPTLLLLIAIAGILAFAPTLDYVPFSRDKIDLENVFNNTTIQLP